MNKNRIPMYYYSVYFSIIWWVAFDFSVPLLYSSWVVFLIMYTLMNSSFYNIFFHSWYKSLLNEFCCLFSAFPTTGFDCHTSPVFSPANPETSIEDCLAHLGEKVFQELKEPIEKALEILLSKWVLICFAQQEGTCS